MRCCYNELLNMGDDDDDVDDDEEEKDEEREEDGKERREETKQREGGLITIKNSINRISTIFVNKEMNLICI